MYHLFREEPAEAESTLARLLAIREKASGPNSPEVATVLDDLGDLFAALADRSSWQDFEAKIEGRPKAEWKSEQYGKKAEEFYKRALAIRERALKPDHPDIVDSLYNLGQLAMIWRQPADGEKFVERWWTLQEAAKVPASERQAKALVMLAAASMDRKDWAEADRRLARAQSILETLNGPESKEASIGLSARTEVAIQAGRFDDAEKLLKRNLEIQAALLGPEEPDVVQARALMAGSYKDHLNDRRAPVLWRRLKDFSEQTDRLRKHDALGDIVNSFADLLRRTNRVVPRPTEEDLAYLKKAGVVLPFVDLDDLERCASVHEYALDDANLEHIARLYGIERLDLGGSLHRGKRITDAGLKHLVGLINLSDLSLSTTNITDAGFAHLASLDNLEKLNLMSTRVSDAGLIHLKGLKNLRELDLSFTDVTDTGLKLLEEFKSLHSLELKYTKVSEAAVQALRRARPDLNVEHEPGPGFFQPAVPPEGVPGAAPFPLGLPAVPRPGTGLPALPSQVALPPLPGVTDKP